MNPRAVILVVLGLLFVAGPAARAGAGSPMAEARIVKAAYIYNLTKFVDWGAGEGKVDARAPITIAVLGRDAVASALMENSPSESLGRPLRVVAFARGEPIPACHVLYIAQSETAHLPGVFESGEIAGVLTVSDIPRFVDVGGMIGFAVERGRVRIEINVSGVRTAGLAVSSKLLEIARIKEGPKR